MKRKRLVVLALCLSVLTPAWIGCREQNARKRIGVVPKAVAHVFWQTVHAGAVAAGREAGVDIEWIGPPQETDFSRQIEIVDSMINGRLDGIVLAPTEATALVRSVERAAEQGIPLSIFDSGINTEKYVSYVSTNNYQAGVLGARKLAELIGGKGNIVMVKMVPGSSSTMEREKGFEDTLAKEFAGIRIVDARYCMSDRAKALEVSENMLTAHTDLDAIFASAEPATVGAAKAVRGRQLGDKVMLVGFDFSDTIEQDLKDGVTDALVVQDPFQIGYTAVTTVAQALRGETPEKRIETPIHVLTAADLARPEIDELLHPDLSKYLN
ncbi:MAG TPA: substrate-binding domain-containing protein [Bryobacterales bacterium]|nr:substrate-binding domain-containing protein [Bryobacterales bacterium]